MRKEAIMSVAREGGRVVDDHGAKGTVVEAVSNTHIRVGWEDEQYTKMAHYPRSTSILGAGALNGSSLHSE